MKTPQDQVREGERRGLPKTQLCVDSTGKHYLLNDSLLTIWCGDVTALG